MRQLSVEHREADANASEASANGKEMQVYLTDLPAEEKVSFLGVQSFADFLEEKVSRKRLLHQESTLNGDAAMNDDIIRIARHEQNFQTRAKRDDLSG
jgi:hypothetical protein